MDFADLSVIHPSDEAAQRKLGALLARAGIRRDAHLDETVCMLDGDGRMIATGSAYGNTLRCLAVDPDFRGEGLLGRIVSFLVERQAERGFGETFLYTKPASAGYMSDLGFSEIARVPDRLVFMSNRPGAFRAYLNRLRRNALVPGRACAVVMNANPFTLGHLELLERASRENDVAHVFVVSEDVSLFSFKDRFRLVREGSAHLSNIFCHPSGSYMISNATFPSYFLKEDDDATRTHAQLDATVFATIAGALNIVRRYVGEEPFSRTTAAYNRELRALLPGRGVEVITVARAENRHTPISASQVRGYIRDRRMDLARPLVPESTYRFLMSEEGRPTVERIERAACVLHD